jgi:general secretion pathway protein H
MMGQDPSNESIGPTGPKSRRQGPSQINQKFFASFFQKGSSFFLSPPGFTLIEILVVLAILGLVLGIMIGRGPMRSTGLQLRAAAGAMAQNLRAARAAAIASNRQVAVAIDPARHVFSVDGRAPVLLAPDLSLDVSDALRGPGTVRIIRFAPDGSDSGGHVVLGTGGRQVQISVQWLTGQVSVADAR